MSLTDPRVAVIVVCPGVKAVTIPVCHPTVATFGAEDVQFTAVVRSCAPVLPTNVPCALSCIDVCCATCALDGAMAIDICCGEATINPVTPWIDPDLTVTIACPIPCPVATPALTVAIVNKFEPQEEAAVMSCLLPSVNVPSAA